MDLRIQKTKKSIHEAFNTMLSEMDYEKITVKELTQRAMINRKTFYLHYNSLDDLLKETQDEMARAFIRRTQSLSRPFDLKEITRQFFLATEEMGKLGQMMICFPNYQYISQKITHDIMEEVWSEEYKSNPIHRLLMCFIAQSTLALYRQWIMDGKPISLDVLIDTTSELLCHGVENFLPQLN